MEEKKTDEMEVAKEENQKRETKKSHEIRIIPINITTKLKTKAF